MALPQGDVCVRATRRCTRTKEVHRGGLICGLRPAPEGGSCFCFKNVTRPLGQTQLENAGKWNGESAIPGRFLAQNEKHQFSRFLLFFF